MRVGLGIGLPSNATTVKSCPGRARLRISVALPFKTWNRTRSPCFTRIGSPWPQHSPVDSEGTVPNFKAMRHASGKRGFHATLSGISQPLHRCCRRKKILCHVATTAIRWFEFFQCQEYFTIVVAWITSSVRCIQDRPARCTDRHSGPLSHAHGCGKSDTRTVLEQTKCGGFRGAR